MSPSDADDSTAAHALADDSLDPADWIAFRADAHRILDDVIDYVQGLRTRPVWRPMPLAVRSSFDAPVPRAPGSLLDVHRRVLSQVVPYVAGNSHPGFMAWVHGGGNIFGVMGELVAAGLNANLGGRDHAPIEIERQVIRWVAELFGFPEKAGGILVTGTSIANFIGVLSARSHALGPAVRGKGIGGAALVAYTSRAAHGCIARAMDMAGLGVDALTLVDTDAEHRLDVEQLRAAIARDRAAGRTPFLVVGTAGTVDTGAIDD
ncbi:MAG: pyridoxal phosphate-dependent decarboxylase family protein, partial [Polyangiales bacterium]